MEKGKRKIVQLGQCLVIIGFAIAALASSSARDTINSPEFKDGFDRGWEVGRRLSSDATPEIQNMELDSIYNVQPDVAQNSESLNIEITK